MFFSSLLFKVRSFIKQGIGTNNFVGLLDISKLPFICETPRDGTGKWRIVFVCWREVSFGIRPSRRCTLIVPGMNNELPAPLSPRRRKTLRNETARWEYEIVACVSACVSLCARLCSQRIRIYTRRTPSCPLRRNQLFGSRAIPHIRRVAPLSRRKSS